MKALFQNSVVLILLICIWDIDAFLITSHNNNNHFLQKPNACSNTIGRQHRHPIKTSSSSPIRPQSSSSTTSLQVLLDVPPHFFATSFIMMGLVLDVSKSFSRLRMEERAWEQRLEEAQFRKLENDPTITELELRQKDAALEWSAYGIPRKQEKERQRREQEEEQELYNDDRQGSRRGRRRTKVMERDDLDDDDDDEEEIRNLYRMSDDEINAFEIEYGIDYDPYYDDPYTEEELPTDLSFKVDGKYGDRIYENGEIFYKDKTSGLFYRQGAKPKSLSFW